MNHVKTALLLTVMTVLLVLLGRWLGGPTGMVIAFGFALVMNVGSYWFSDKIVLAMYRAQPISPSEAPELYRMVERLCERASLPMPKLYVIQDPTPNAFATGRDPQHSAVAVNEGLLRILSHEEVEGVVAHELAHIKNRDTLISTIAATMAGAVTMIAHMGQYALLFAGMGGRDRDEDSNPLGMLIMVIVAPIAATIIQLWISRTREFQADRTGSEICGRPLALASALQKLERAVEVRPMHAEPSTAHMFIVNPLRGSSFRSLFSTHPSTQERVQKLEALASEMGAAGQTAYSWR
ncbi:MAG: zinc metalloprotease HtpX [Armatimonadota bacterium]